MFVSFIKSQTWRVRNLLSVAATLRNDSLTPLPSIMEIEFDGFVRAVPPIHDHPKSRKLDCAFHADANWHKAQSPKCPNVATFRTVITK